MGNGEILQIRLVFISGIVNDYFMALTWHSQLFVLLLGLKGNYKRGGFLCMQTEGIKIAFEILGQSPLK